jgi:hypothetical protein
VRSSWREHRGKPYFHADYAGYGEDLPAFMIEVNAVNELLCRQPEKSVALLVDVRGTVGTPEAINLIKKSAALTEPFVGRMAVLGVYGVRRMLFEAVARFSGQTMVAFDEEGRAVEWLVAE